MPSKPEIGFGPDVGLGEIGTSIAELADLRRKPVGGPTQTNSGLKFAFVGYCSYVGLPESLALGFVFLDHAVPDGDDTVRVLGDIVFVRHEDDRIAFRVQAIKQRHDLVAGL